MSEHMVRCYICKEDFRATTSHINLICKECQDKEKKELIGEFLKDWRWGRLFAELRKKRWIGNYRITEYWKWFEDKWEARLKKE